MGQTKIEWTATYKPDGAVVPGYTFNPWLGCQHVSPACEHCYAENWAKRYGRPELWASGAASVRQRTGAGYWRQPLKWARETPGAKVFCASLADVFEDHANLAAWRRDLWKLIDDTPELTWLLLTKRPQNIAGAMPSAWSRWPDNVWMGTTVEDQRRADERISSLLQVPARVRFLSMEPLLGRVVLGDALGACRCLVEAEDGAGMHAGNCPATRPRIDWVIGGGESGGDARPTHPQWATDLREECRAADVSFFWKQWGEWLPFNQGPEDLFDDQYVPRRRARRGEDQAALNDVYGRRCKVETKILHVDGKHCDVVDPDAFLTGSGAMQAFRVGKKLAGRRLDGREWNEQPGRAR